VLGVFLVFVVFSMSASLAGFLLAAGALLLAVLFLLLRPLLRSSPHGKAPVGRREANLSILRDELRELEKSRDEGLLDEDGFAQAKDELQRRLLEEAGPEALDVPSAPSAPGKRTAVALAVAIPLAAAGGYALLGNPPALDAALMQQAHRARAETQETAQDIGRDIDVLLRRLTAHLETEPNDMQGWILLARSYKMLGRFPEAAEAFGRAEAALGGHPALLADYAETLALAGGSFAGKPDALIARALAAAPDDPQVLFAAGAAANARRDYAAAVDYWGRLLPRLDPASDEARALGAAVEQARRLLDGQREGDKD
jgi:cytochrome c-type biogenesis protein CcmH